mmetsp:Transcript_19919/g.53276  ORF Transcript_19919/g.53276 Transcript_19919/m.53276 type:complete len:242 (+) Transcript_19919:18-743(+)
MTTAVATVHTETMDRQGRHLVRWTKESGSVRETKPLTMLGTRALKSISSVSATKPRATAFSKSSDSSVVFTNHKVPQIIRMPRTVNWTRATNIIHAHLLGGMLWMMQPFIPCVSFTPVLFQSVNCTTAAAKSHKSLTRFTKVANHNKVTTRTRTGPHRNTTSSKYASTVSFVESCRKFEVVAGSTSHTPLSSCSLAELRQRLRASSVESGNLLLHLPKWKTTIHRHVCSTRFAENARAKRR